MQDLVTYPIAGAPSFTLALVPEGRDVERVLGKLARLGDKHCPNCQKTLRAKWELEAYRCKDADKCTARRRARNIKALERRPGFGFNDSRQRTEYDKAQKLGETDTAYAERLAA